MALSSIFSGVKIYEEGWQELDVQPFSEEDLQEIVRAVVVAGEYGLSAKMTLKSGGCFFLGMDCYNSWSAEGDVLDLKKCEIVTLKRQGEIIHKVRG